MAMDLAQLQQLMTQGAQAQTQLTGLDERTARAAALRDQPIQSRDPVAGVISVLGRELGRSRERKLAPQREQATGDVNRLSGAMEMYKLEQEEAKRKQAQTNVEAGRVLTQATAAATKKNREETAAAKIEAARVLAEAKVKATEKKKTAFRPPTQTQIKDFEDTAFDTGKAVDMLKAFKPSYGNVETILGKKYKGVPILGTLSNWLSRTAPIATDEEREAKAEWWADYGKLLELPERHALFGSALSRTEGTSWDKVTINPNMEPEQIQIRLNKMLSDKDRALKYIAKNALIKGWDEEWVRENYEEYMEKEKKGEGPTDEQKASPDAVNTAQQQEAPVEQQEAPAVGTVEGGYEFLGGDPADSNNWKQQ